MTTITARIDAAIAANEAAHVDSVARWHLNSLSDRLRRYRCNLSHLNAEEQALYAGPNMRGPAIDDLIEQSAWYRERGAVTIPDLPRVTTKVCKLDPNIWGKVA